MPVKHYTTTVGPIEITAAPPGPAPWTVDTIIEEQDTSLLLGDTHRVSDTGESYVALVGKMEIQTPLAPGAVLVKHTMPRRFIAIVYDISRRPIYREEWIASALEQLFQNMKTHRSRYIAMPLLGVTHGHYLHTNFLELLCSMLPAVHAGYPEKIWLVTPATNCRDIISCLENIQRENMRRKNSQH